MWHIFTRNTTRHLKFATTLVGLQESFYSTNIFLINVKLLINSKQNVLNVYFLNIFFYVYTHGNIFHCNKRLFVAKDMLSPHPDPLLPVLARAQCSHCGRSGCRAAAWLAPQLCSPPYTPDTPNCSLCGDKRKEIC